jgi:hypothetical protein
MVMVAAGLFVRRSGGVGRDSWFVRVKLGSGGERGKEYTVWKIQRVKSARWCLMSWSFGGGSEGRRV